ncbi:VOC family protein [Deinococcus humi]|uniref:Catechol 2,3-dioxygenase-like lactoylglutathione lyase family enzyme n=1 Tax=Deinococcus humi TaxID=662880 RepID=A0A7W8NGE4_9DEIO|nr:VOC family protein [Deinococcus humi]MBB5365431.1 catechol 2,3-dioxygenase-like lactoylglutathione lyase family enzyme [Deinococcus humi]GGO37222.1 chaP protein [Deinococcus humi]
MPIHFHHVLLAAHDKAEAATFLAWLFGLNAPTFWGPFATVYLEDGTHIQFAKPETESIQMQHVAFLVDNRTFDEIYGRMLTSQLDHWADPQMTLPGQVNTHHGGRGVYFKDPTGHGLEIITRLPSS